MTKMKTLGAALILSATVVAPAAAQEWSRPQPNAAQYSGVYRLKHFRGTYNQAPVYTPAPRGSIGEDFQFDRSFPGGHNPDLNPPGT